MIARRQLPSTYLTDQEWAVINTFVAKVRSRFAEKLVSVILYGSRARAEARPDSDMDLAVIMTDVDAQTRQAVRYLAVDVWLESGIYLSTRVWSDPHWQTMAEIQTSLYQNIHREGIELFHATPA